MSVKENKRRNVSLKLRLEAPIKNMATMRAEELGVTLSEYLGNLVQADVAKRVTTGKGTVIKHGIVILRGRIDRIAASVHVDADPEA